MFDWFNEDSKLFASDEYFQGKSIQERSREIADAVGHHYGGKAVADKVYEYLGRGFYSLSSPVWANFASDRGLPISCNGVSVEDDIAHLMRKVSEVAMQTKNGAGTSAYLGNLRARGSKISTGGTADGAVHYGVLFDNVTDIISQGSVRRGSIALYYDIEGADFEEFLRIRDDGHPIQKASIGVCIGDEWMEGLIAGDPAKVAKWRAILRKRFESGYPYLFFRDTVNKGKAKWYRDYLITHSNLCAEIAQPDNANESFVCCLMSMNLAQYHKWKHTDAVRIAVIIMDAVIEEYIRKTRSIPHMQDSNYSAVKWRAIGIGTLGLHTALQDRMHPFGSPEAKVFNIEVHYEINKAAKAASKELAKELGEPEGLKGYGYRNGTLHAIAPTTSSSFILGQVSPSIEPLASNYFIKDLAKGRFAWRNPKLKEVLQAYDKDSQEVWQSILQAGGSVQHLEFLTDYEREVFLTFGELDQAVVIELAADRQRYIDQAQSLNLMIHPDTPLKVVNALYIQAWQSGVKTLYYQRSTNPALELLRQFKAQECVACQA